MVNTNEHNLKRIAEQVAILNAGATVNIAVQFAELYSDCKDELAWTLYATSLLQHPFMNAESAAVEADALLKQHKKRFPSKG